MIYIQADMWDQNHPIGTFYELTAEAVNLIQHNLNIRSPLLTVALSHIRCWKHQLPLQFQAQDLDWALDLAVPAGELGLEGLRPAKDLPQE